MSENEAQTKYSTNSESTGDGIEADVDLVDKVCGIADTHERASGVDIILPTIQLFIVLQGEMIPFVPGFEKQTIRLQVNPLDI